MSFLMVIIVSAVCRIGCGMRDFDGIRRRGRMGRLGNRLRMIVVGLFVCDSRIVVLGFCVGRRMVAVLQARSYSYRCGGSDHGASGEEHNRVRKG